MPVRSVSRLRPLVWALLLLAALLPGAPAVSATAAVAAAPPAAANGREVHIFVRDSIFNPPLVRVAVGTTVVWHFEGRSPHTVTADDGSFDSGILKRGQTFRVTFDQPGRHPYHCKPHGGAGGRGMAGVIMVGESAGQDIPADPIRKDPRPDGPATIRVPADVPTIQAAVDQGHPADLILVAPGVYRESVVVLTPRLTIRGLDRNRVILDGDFQMDNGIKVLGADGVVIENLTARHYTLNGFYWTGVKGYRGSYLTAYNNGDYGIYAFDSRYGQLDNSYASGNPDSGFYIGQCQPCDALITGVVAESNGLGYSGTNAGGNLTIANSVWRGNWSGLAPNTLDTELLAPQHGTRIVGNIISGNHNARAPAKAITYPAFGVGVLIAGGNHNIVEGNLITDHANYGVLVAPNVDENFHVSGGNRVRRNRVAASGRADLALAAPAAPGNCFSGNAAATAMPPLIESLYGCGSALSRLGGGEPAATLPLLARAVRSELQLATGTGDWQTQPPPPPQPNMPAALSPPAPAWPTPESAALGRLVVAVPEPLAPESAARSFPLGVFALSTWWVMGFGLYVYLFPFVLYTSWVTIAIWDLFRREDLPAASKLGWLALVLLAPMVGPAAYYALGRSPLPGLMRFGLLGGGLAAYLILALIAVWVAPG